MTRPLELAANESWRHRLTLGDPVAIHHYVALGVAAENLFAAVRQRPPVFNVVLWKVIDA